MLGNGFQRENSIVFCLTANHVGAGFSDRKVARAGSRRGTRALGSPPSYRRVHCYSAAIQAQRFCRYGGHTRILSPAGSKGGFASAFAGWC